jgi:hypothetical protein
MAEPHVVTALRAKHAELAGEIQAAEKRLAQLRADLVHLDATLRCSIPMPNPAPSSPGGRTGARAGLATASCRVVSWTRYAYRRSR